MHAALDGNHIVAMASKQTADGVSREDMQSALLRSGYLLESRLETILSRRDFRVLANGLYPDPETGKPRELDLYASYAACIPCGPAPDDFISPVLIIECVNPPQPIAFITKEWPDTLLELSSRWDALKIAGAPLQIPRSEAEYNWTWLAHTLQMNRYHHYRVRRLATQFCSFEKKRSATEWMAKHRDEDYDALRKLCDATIYYHDREYLDPDSTRRILTLEFLYPVLVVQGQIFEVMPGPRSLRLASRDHVQFRLPRMLGDRQSEFQIDVVTERFFPRYLDLIMKEMAATGRRMVRRYEEIQSMIETRITNEAKYGRLRPKSADTASNAG